MDYFELERICILTCEHSMASGTCSLLSKLGSWEDRKDFVQKLRATVVSASRVIIDAA